MSWEVLAAAFALSTLAACDGGGSSAGADGAVDSAINGMCGASVPAGQACNTLVDMGAAVTPTCTTGTMPTGQGGTIVDGIYALTAQTYYNRTSCPSIPLSETVEIAGNCLQIATAGPFPGTGSGTFTVAGSSMTLTPTCLHIAVDGATSMPSTPNHTFTATATTFTLFTSNSAAGNPNPDDVAVFTKR